MSLGACRNASILCDPLDERTETHVSGRMPCIAALAGDERLDADQRLAVVLLQHQRAAIVIGARSLRVEVGAVRAQRVHVGGNTTEDAGALVLRDDAGAGEAQHLRRRRVVVQAAETADLGDTVDEGCAGLRQRRQPNAGQERLGGGNVDRQTDESEVVGERLRIVLRMNDAVVGQVWVHLHGDDRAADVGGAESDGEVSVASERKCDFISIH